MVLELAVKAGCQIIITYNTRDFAGVEEFGIKLLEPPGLLRLIGNLNFDRKTAAQAPAFKRGEKRQGNSPSINDFSVLQYIF
jgi:hypothetical protein